MLMNEAEERALISDTEHAERALLLREQTQAYRRSEQEQR